MTEPTSTLPTPHTVEGIVLMDADEARQATARIRTTASELRRDIFDFNARLGWRALGYGSFRDWAAAELDQSIRHTYRQLAAAEAETDLGVTIGHTPEAHLRPLAGVPTDDRPAVWARANELAGDEADRTAVHVEQAVAEYNRDEADADTLTPYEAAVAAQYEARLRTEATAAEARADSEAALAALRGAMRAGPFRWPEAEAQIAALPAEQQAPWVNDLNQLRRIDQQLRDRQWQGLQRLVDNIADAELRAFQVVIIRGAVRELILPWPFSSSEHDLNIATGTLAEHIPEAWDEWIERARSIGHKLTLGLHGVFTVSAPGQGNLYSGPNWVEAIALIRRRELRSDAPVEAEPANNEARIEDLMQRAAACGYELRLVGKGAIRWLKDGQPWGGSRDLDAAEARIREWETQARNAQLAQEYRERTQQRSALQLTDRDVLYAQVEQKLAEALRRLGDDGERLLATIMFPLEEGTPGEILWEAWTTAAGGLNTADLRVALGIAVPAAEAA